MSVGPVIFRSPPALNDPGYWGPDIDGDGIPDWVYEAPPGIAGPGYKFIYSTRRKELIVMWGEYIIHRCSSRFGRNEIFFDPDGNFIGGGNVEGGIWAPGGEDSNGNGCIEGITYEVVVLSPILSVLEVCVYCDGELVKCEQFPMPTSLEELPYPEDVLGPPRIGHPVPLPAPVPLPGQEAIELRLRHIGGLNGPGTGIQLQLNGLGGTGHKEMIWPNYPVRLDRQAFATAQLESDLYLIRVDGAKGSLFPHYWMLSTGEAEWMPSTGGSATGSITQVEASQPEVILADAKKLWTLRTMVSDFIPEPGTEQEMGLNAGAAAGCADPAPDHEWPH